MNPKTNAVQKMQEYIREHMAETVTLADLARASCYSPWHAHRLFTETLHISPADYIRRFRLSASALKLRDGKVKIADMAFLTGFGSVDGYQRAFLREFGVSPGEYAKNPVPLWLFTPYDIKYREDRKEKPMEKIQNVFIQLLEKPDRDVIIKRGIRAADYFAYCEEVGCDVWGLLLSIPSISGEPVCMWLPESMIPKGTSTYVQGTEVSAGYQGMVPDGFEVIHLPPCKYLMFQGEPFLEEDYCEAIEQLQAAIVKFDLTARGFSRDLQNPRIQLEPQGSRGYIELLPVQ